MLKSRIPYLIVTLLLLVSCSSDDCTKASGERVFSTREYRDVKMVDLGISAKLNLVHDTTAVLSELRITTQGNITDKINSQLLDGVLSINFSDCIEQHKDIEIELRYPSLEGIIISGSGDIHSGIIIKQSSFSVLINGSGEAHLLMDVDTIHTQISSNGLAEYSGIATHHFLSVDGSGDLLAFELFSDTLQANMTSSGNAWVRVDSLIDAKLLSNGDLSYKGSPRIESTIVGIGQIIDAN